MGGSVAGVISVSEDNDSGPTPMYAMAKGAAASDASAPPPVEQGTLNVSAGVTVVFAYGA